MSTPTETDQRLWPQLSILASPKNRFPVAGVNYSDSDLTFLLLVRRNHALTDCCLANLRRHFFQARLIVRSDGDPDPRHWSFVERYRADYRCEQRLFPVENGGAVIRRSFEIFLEEPTRFLFKLDPDTHVHRRFRYLPDRRGHFGTLQEGPDVRSVQGGCMGFTRDVVEEIVHSGLLNHSDLKNPEVRRSESQYWRILADRARRVGLASFDWTLGWIASELGISLFNFGEVHSTWKTPVDNHDLRFAITHPSTVMIASHSGMAP